MKNSRGFSIIEVVLVLAIAALIFLMIFVAWPALQRGQRDTARKNDALSVVAGVTRFISNNNRLPNTDAEFRGVVGKLSMYENPGAATPPGGLFILPAIYFPANATNVPRLDDMYLASGQKSCDLSGGMIVFTPGGAKDFVILYSIEAGGAGRNICLAG